MLLAPLAWIMYVSECVHAAQMRGHIDTPNEQYSSELIQQYSSELVQQYSSELVQQYSSKLVQQ